MPIPHTGKGRCEVTQGCEGVLNCQVSWATYVHVCLWIASSHLPILQTYLRPGNEWCYQDRVVLYLCLSPALRILISNSKLWWQEHQHLAFCQNPFSLVGLHAWNTYVEFLVCTILSSAKVATNQNAEWSILMQNTTNRLQCLLRWLSLLFWWNLLVRKWKSRS